MKKANQLSSSTSPYLLQHAYNPVDWYPWGDKAFEKAKLEDKPVFLSIGYSTCHWCHVMAHESFEDDEVAALLNAHFACIKVDKEERPDIDSIYMNVCMAMTGGGGWPMTIIMEHTGKPFFAGTYFPKNRRHGSPGLMEILRAIRDAWENDRDALLHSANEIVRHINRQPVQESNEVSEDELFENAASYYRSAFDPTYGGFGRAPKFPTPHNLMLLMELSQSSGEKALLTMAEKTLMQMAKGGIFDQIGFGFSRYSTDEKWLAPHFEKMLYDNALLLMAYTRAFKITANPIYKAVAEKIVLYLTQEMTHPDGGFFSAQDADSDGEEGKYYVFSQDEILSVLGEKEGKEFCELYDITPTGNFEGKNIPNQIKESEFNSRLEPLLPRLYEYRKTRTTLHRDDKILTAWNGLMIAALAEASIVFGDRSYLEMAEKAAQFIDAHLCEGDSVFVSWRDNNRSSPGFIDDYAFYIFALIALYNATLDTAYLCRAEKSTAKTIADFFDHENGGFYLYGSGSETLVSRPKETYDGAMPSGNSVMSMNLLHLTLLTSKPTFEAALEKQLLFMNNQAAAAPAGNAFHLLALLKKENPGKIIHTVLGDPSELNEVKEKLTGCGLVVIYEHETEEYKLLNNETTYYVCENQICHPPVNEINIT